MLLILLLLLALTSNSFGEDIITLSSVDEFTDFANDVNSGTTYSGTTVYLDSDLSFSGRTLEPIGKYYGYYATYHFRGVFDGQGHIISNLKMNSSSEYIGLFGYSTGLTIRNVVLDGSCSIKSTFTGNDYARVGGIIGYYDPESEDCNIEDTVNMANVAFNGSISRNLFIGGIVGILYSSYRYSAYVKNCVNYGSVTDLVTVNNGYWAELGGIVGLSKGDSSIKYIQNCLNYGTITHSGTSANLIIGGIVSNGAYYTYIENCVSAGKIVTQATASGSNYIGSIVGEVKTDMYINYCYYTSDVNVSSIYGYGTPSSAIGTPTSTTTVDSELVSKLNKNATSCNWNKWLLNANNATVTFKMGDDKELSFSSQIILIPEPVKEGYTLFWCKDAECTEGFDPETESISGNTVLYANWTPNNFTVTFNVSGGNPLSEDEATKTVTFDKKYGELPEPNRAGYTFTGWFNESDELITNVSIVTTPKNHTLYARWTANTYNVTFNVNGGGSLPVNNSTKTVAFDEKYGELPEPNRIGYTFAGWLDGDNESTTNETIVTTPKNHTLYANWTPNNYTVTLDADGGGGVPISKPVVFDSAYGELQKPNRTGYMFAGWFTETPGGDPVNSSTIVSSPYDHKIYAHWTATQRVITFDFGNGKTMKTIQSYGDAIIYPSEVPSKSFHKFRGWCAKGVVASSDRCNVTHVPASDLTLAASFDAEPSLAAGFSIAIIAVVLFVVLLAVVLVLVIAVRKMRRNYELIGVELDEGDEKTVNRANERVEERIFQQVVATKISNSFAKALKKALKKAEKNMDLDEILADLGVECEDDKSADVIESFRTNDDVQNSIASAVHKKENLVAVAEYLRLLYMTVRDQEEYEEFDELYFGMKNIRNFLDKMDEETISFCGVVSGFTSKRKVIQFLMQKVDEEKEDESNGMPSGVLFKVKKGRGYKIGELDEEETDEVLFEVNSVFKVESIKEVTKDRFIAVTLSFISPETEGEMVKM